VFSWLLLLLLLYIFRYSLLVSGAVVAVDTPLIFVCLLSSLVLIV